MSAITWDGDYPPESLGAEVLRLCAEVDAACPGLGLGDLVLADWNARWVPMAEAGLGLAWEAMRS